MAYSFEIKDGIEPTKVVGRGAPDRMGRNKLLLSKMKPGQSIWGVPKKKVASIRYTAWMMKIKIKVRKQPGSTHYAIWRLT